MVGSLRSRSSACGKTALTLPPPSVARAHECCVDRYTRLPQPVSCPPRHCENGPLNTSYRALWPHLRSQQLWLPPSADVLSPHRPSPLLPFATWSLSSQQRALSANATVTCRHRLAAYHKTHTPSVIQVPRGRFKPLDDPVPASRQNPLHRLRIRWSLPR